MDSVRRAVVITVSDRAWLAIRADESGPAAVQRLRSWGWEVVGTEILPDEPERISESLRRLADEESVDLLVTTGGTGFSRRDQTPEATAEVADRLVPSLVEWVRSHTAQTRPHAALSRGTAAIRGRTLILNLPGNPKAVTEYLDLLQRILPHAIDQVRARPTFRLERGPEDQHPTSPDPRSQKGP